MILLDTNVVSELRKIGLGKADARVIEWDRQQASATKFLSVLVVQEIEKGILLLARRDERQAMLLREWMDGALLPSFSGRILPVDLPVALACAKLHVPDPAPFSDSLIAATAMVHGLTIATRNVADFRRFQVNVLNPWEA
jgi:predicted nucleic acid-binding protein